MDMDKTRLDYLDIYKGIGILLVLLGHIVPDDSTVKALIYSFHMPLFFFAYGIVSYSLPIKSFIKKRWRSLLFPYIFWGFAFAGFDFQKKLLFLFYGTGEAIHVAESNGMLWFLAAMFIGALLSNVALLLAEKSKHPIIIETISCLIFFGFSVGISRFHNTVVFYETVIGLPFAIDVSSLAASFIMAGYLVKHILLDHMKIKRLDFKCLTVGITLFILSLWIGIFFNSGYGDYQSMEYYRLGVLPLYWACAITASTGLLIIIYNISYMQFPFKKNIIWIGQNSLSLFITHSAIRRGIRYFAIRYNNILIYLIGYIVLIAFSCLCTVIINMYIPALAGKTTNRKES